MSQQQAEANVRAQFAAQVAATLANDSQEKQYRLEQATQSQFTPVSGCSKSQPETTVYPTGRPSPPVDIGGTHTVPMTGMPQFPTQNFEPHQRERKIIQIKDPNSNKDVTQEFLNHQPSGSVTGSTGGTTNNSSPESVLSLAANAVHVVLDAENRHEDAAQPLKSAELPCFRRATDSKVTEDVDQQVAKLKSTAESSEAEVLPITIALGDALGVEKVTGYESNIEIYGVTVNPIDTHRTGLY